MTYRARFWLTYQSAAWSAALYAILNTGDFPRMIAGSVAALIMLAMMTYEISVSETTPGQRNGT
jgi:hypothetical protein